VAIVATPLRNDSGEVTGAIALLQDVTQKRSLEQLLVHSQKMEAVGQLAGGVAHDFNNLLAVIEGSGEMALEELVGHVAREDVADMVAAAKRAASLTRQLLAFSRREAQRGEDAAALDRRAHHAAHAARPQRQRHHGRPQPD
jgi:signal transduction histidine kinase